MELKLEDFDVSISAQRIRERVNDLGARIRADYEGKDLVAVGVLKGSFIFLADLVRHLPPSTTCDFLRCSSYKGIHSSGKVRIEFDLTQPIEGKHVLLIEDIIDTGLTADFVMKTLAMRSPASLKICTLLDKPARRKSAVDVSYKGFTIDDKFVIGYGLDYDGAYRNLREIRSLKPEVQAQLVRAELH